MFLQVNHILIRRVNATQTDSRTVRMVRPLRHRVQTKIPRLKPNIRVPSIRPSLWPMWTIPLVKWELFKWGRQKRPKFMQNNAEFDFTTVVGWSIWGNWRKLTVASPPEEIASFISKYCFWKFVYAVLRQQRWGASCESLLLFTLFHDKLNIKNLMPACLLRNCWVSSML